MNVEMLLTVLTVAGVVWATGEALDSWFEGPLPITFRPRRELVSLVAGGLGAAVYVLLTEGAPDVVPATATATTGVVIGYWITWRGGSLDDFGTAVIWSSPWHVTAWGVGALVTYVGSLWVEDLTTVGIAAMFGAVGLGAGRYVYGLRSTWAARRLVESEMSNIGNECPECGTTVLIGDQFCMSCGAEQTRYCSICGEPLTEAARFCMHCGAEDVGLAPEPFEGSLTRRFCYVCSTPMYLTAGACPACGSAQPEPCALCGAPTRVGNRDCGFCGIDLDVGEAARAEGLFEAAEAGVGD